MAESLAHRWGQIIGDGFEMFVRGILGEVAQRHGLYLDFKRPRATRGGQGKVTWQDGYGNKHDLDRPRLMNSALMPRRQMAQVALPRSSFGRRLLNGNRCRNLERPTACSHSFTCSTNAR